MRHEYRLTDKGAALFTVIVGLKQWGDRFGSAAKNGKPMDLVDRTDGHPLDPALIDALSGRRLELTNGAGGGSRRCASHPRFLRPADADAADPALALRDSASLWRMRLGWPGLPAGKISGAMRIAPPTSLEDVGVNAGPQ